MLSFHKSGAVPRIMLSMFLVHHGNLAAIYLTPPPLDHQSSMFLGGVILMDEAATSQALPTRSKGRNR